MLNFLKRVKRVSQFDRVSSYNNPEKYLAVFFVIAISIAVLLYIPGPTHASDITPENVIKLTNVDRKEKGVSELSENEKLSRAANEKAENMIEKNYFSHNAPDGTTPWHWFEGEGYDYNYAGENLAMDFSQAEKMNKAWLDSPTHRANILNEKYKDIGVAVKDGVIAGHSTTVVVQIFGSGDKSVLRNEETARLLPQEENKAKMKNIIPSLPSGERRKETVFASQPLITFPRENEVLRNKDIEIIGRAKPNSNVNIFDNESPAGSAVSDGDGWFRLKIESIVNGNHRLIAKTENSSVRYSKAQFSREIIFLVDREKPALNYRLYADSKTENYVVELYANEENCILKLGKQKISGEKKAMFVLKSNSSSVVASVLDAAGNNTKKQIDLVNYFSGNGKGLPVERLASSLFLKTIYSADSGRKAMVKNIGINSHQLVSSYPLDSR